MLVAPLHESIDRSAVKLGRNAVNPIQNGAYCSTGYIAHSNMVNSHATRSEEGCLRDLRLNREVSVVRLNGSASLVKFRGRNWVLWPAVGIWLELDQQGNTLDGPQLGTLSEFRNLYIEGCE